MAKDFTLPELGENIESGNVTRVLVSVGDTIAVDQPVIELETDKATVEVPSTVAGKVTSIAAEEGQALEVGAVVLSVEEESGEAESKSEEPPADEPETSKEVEEESAKKPQQAEFEESEEEKEEPIEETPAPKEKSAESTPAKDEPKPKAAASEEPSEKRSSQGKGPVPASPSVRRLAREIGVDIHLVTGTGSGGRITEEDVKSYSRRVNTDAGGLTPVAPSGGPSTAPKLPDFSRWGTIEREELTGIRRRTAENMAHAWATVPQVTQFDQADITDIEALRKSHGKQVEAAGGKLTMTAILLKVLPAALKRFPQFNTSLDTANNEIIYKKYYHIGVAVDTDRGLLVPVVRDCDQKSVTQIAVELGEIAERARNRKTSLDEMQGGTFTVSNLGGLGGTAFTPIVNAPEVAILGVARARVEPVYQDGQFVPRTMLPLSLTYDHRVIDGADGARFLRWICTALEQPFLLFLESA